MKKELTLDVLANLADKLSRSTDDLPHSALFIPEPEMGPERDEYVRSWVHHAHMDGMFAEPVEALRLSFDQMRRAVHDEPFSKTGFRGETLSPAALKRFEKMWIYVQFSARIMSGLLWLKGPLRACDSDESTSEMLFALAVVEAHRLYPSEVREVHRDYDPGY